MEKKAIWVAFNKVRGIGAVRFQNLISYFGSLEDAWRADYGSLRQAGLSEKTTNNLVDFRKEYEPEATYTAIIDSGIQVITWDEQNYPKKLKEIEHHPPVLYVKGNITSQDDCSIAVVGTRQPTSYGRQATSELTAFLAQNQITVVSGLARGIDSIAHDYAIKQGGRTLAVLGNGVDVIYPAENRDLYHRIIENGALVSEYSPGTKPDGINFPPRNRIISGLSLATVVIEAGEKSGALISAEFAAVQGREVFALPGQIFSPKSKGTNRLIRDGAIPLVRYDDVLTLLQLDQIEELRYARKVFPEDEIEKNVVAVLIDEPMHVDEIGSLTGIAVEKVTAALVMLELKGLVRQTGTMTYQAMMEQPSEYNVGLE